VLPTLTTISKRVVRQLRENEAAAKATAPPAKQPAPLAARAPSTPKQKLAPEAPAPAPLRHPAPIEDPASADASGVGARSEPQASEAHQARVTPIDQPGRPGSTPGRPGSLKPPPPLTPPAHHDPRTTAVVLDPDPDPLDLDHAALDADVELVDERDDAVARAQGLLDVSWSELDDFATPDAAAADAEPPLPDAAYGSRWRLVATGAPEIVEPATLRIPLVVADAVGRELRFRLSVSLEPLLDE